MALINLFNHLGHIFLNGKEKEATDYLEYNSFLLECEEVGLGNSKQKLETNRSKSSNRNFNLYKNIFQNK